MITLFTLLAKRLYTVATVAKITLAKATMVCFSLEQLRGTNTSTKIEEREVAGQRIAAESQSFQYPRVRR